MSIIEFTEASSSPEHGRRPEARSLEERMAAGIILLDKAAGPTSHQLASWARELFAMEKMGHGGTLDPFATGVLPLLLGKSMRLTASLLAHDKTYIAVMRIHGGFDEEQFNAAIERQRGRVYNVPPDISAVKVQVRTRRIKRLERLDDDGEYVTLEIDCEAGTYIRTMARDIGLLINRRCELVELRRSRSGIFNLDNCVSMQELADAVWLWQEKGQEEALMRLIQPMELLTRRYPKVIVKDSAAASLAHGSPLMKPGLVSMPDSVKAGQEVAIYTLKGELVALAELLFSTEEITAKDSGEVARSNCVLLNPGIYPRFKA
ncbi:MAG: RNA-guided pseudouridylation complex pseudouridine synthase subunit Cbf5 [Candidatus Poseidoniales archaeon]|jgi:H/ACA ribonucleoprotein complex subunit 4